MGIGILPAPAGGSGTGQPSATEGGSVAVGDAAVVLALSLDDGESLNITEATFLSEDGTPAPTGLNLSIVTLDGAGGGTERTVILTGDGSTPFVSQSGDPLASYTNSSGTAQTTAVVVDNGQFSGATGNTQSVFANVLYEEA